MMTKALDIVPEDGNSLKEATPPTLEQRLFQLLRQHHVRNPSVKEFNECWAFAKAVQPFYASSSIRVILDVAGGHGALAAILLILFPSATHAVVIDPAAAQHQVTGVQRAWKEYLVGPEDHDMRLIYQHECLRKALPLTIQQLTRSNCLNHTQLLPSQVHPSHILVVACHACQHLSEETARIACSMGTHVALMPCCQKDHVGSFKAFAKSIHMPMAPIMDILLAGKCQSWMNTGPSHNISYQVKMRTIDSSITPQNRLILCKAQYQGTSSLEKRKYAVAHTKLQLAYQRAHGKTNINMGIKEETLYDFKQSDQTLDDSWSPSTGKIHQVSLVVGFMIGCILSTLVFYCIHKFNNLHLL